MDHEEKGKKRIVAFYLVDVSKIDVSQDNKSIFPQSWRLLFKCICSWVVRVGVSEYARPWEPVSLPLVSAYT